MGIAQTLTGGGERPGPPRIDFKRLSRNGQTSRKRNNEANGIRCLTPDFKRGNVRWLQSS